MKISIAQIEIVPGDIAANRDSAIRAVSQAKEAGSEVIVFPQAPLTGALVESQFSTPSFSDDRRRAVKAVADAATGIRVVFSDGGAPLVLENGAVHSPSSAGAAAMLFGDIGVICPVCADSTLCPNLADDVRKLVADGAKTVFIPASCRFAKGARAARAATLGIAAATAGVPIVFANCTGVQDVGKTVYAFDGGSGIFLPDGRSFPAASPFDPAVAAAEITCDGNVAGLAETTAEDNSVMTVEALRHGVSRLMARLGLSRVVIGVSGGIDSAVSTALYGSILPPKDILLVGMPGPFTSATTRGLGKTLAANLGARFAEFPIGDAVELTKREFANLVSSGPHGGVKGDWTLSSFAVENVQARDRGSRVLAAAAAAFGGVVSCNANKDECTVGYGTLYGDILGWLSCLGDLWKGEVYDAGRTLNEKFFKREIIPEGIFKIKPSAELSEKQAVEKGLGDPLDYPYHDCLFRSWVEAGATPEESLDWYLSGKFEEKTGYRGNVKKLFPTAADFTADLERWWKLHKGLSVAKRMQAPPVLAVSDRPYGSFPESQIGPRFTSRYAEMKNAAIAAGR